MNATKARKHTNKKNMATLKDMRREIKDIIRTADFEIKREAKKGNYTYELKLKPGNSHINNEVIRHYKAKGFRIWAISTDCEKYLYYTIAW